MHPADGAYRNGPRRALHGAPPWGPPESPAARSLSMYAATLRGGRLVLEGLLSGPRSGDGVRDGGGWYAVRNIPPRPRFDVLFCSALLTFCCRSLDAHRVVRSPRRRWCVSHSTSPRDQQIQCAKMPTSEPGASSPPHSTPRLLSRRRSHHRILIPPFIMRVRGGPHDYYTRHLPYMPKTFD